MKTKKTKKKTTKKVAKKTTKKSVRKTSKKKEKPLVHATSEQCFWVTDGNILINLIDLRDAFDGMHDDTFLHHVSREKNDFADWVEYVLEDAELAVKVRKSKKPKSARKVVVSRLRIYTF